MWWLSGGLLLAVLLVAPRARAQDAAPVVLVATVEPARLSYTAAPGCFDEETFHHAVSSFMDKGRDPFDASSPVELRVTFKKVRGGYRGSVQKIPAKGDPWPEESWTGATCDGVFREIARLASMRVLGPPTPVPPPPAPSSPPARTPSSEPSQPPPDPVASKASRVAPAPDASLRPTPPPTPPRTPMDLTLTLSTAFLVTAGFTADVGPALQIAGGLRRDWFSLDLEGRVVFPSKVYAREPLDPKNTTTIPQTFDVSQVTALAVPCVRFLTYFGGCAVGQLGTLIAQLGPTTQFELNVSAGPRLRVEVPLGDRFAVFAFGEALFKLRGAAKDFSLPGPPDGKVPNVVWDQSVVSGFFGAGVLVKFQ